MQPDQIYEIMPRHEIESSLADIATNINLFPRQVPEVDDSARFIRTYNALPSSGGRILFPAGTFTIQNVAITPTKPIMLKGAGINATKITRTSANIFLNFNSGSVGASAGIFLDFEDMTFDGAGYHATGLAFLYIEQLRIKNVKIQNCGVAGYAAGNRGSIDGVYAYYVNRAFVDDCIFDGNERDGFHGLPIQHLKIRNTFFTNNGRLGAANEPDVSNPRLTTSMYPLTTSYIDNHCENNGAGGLHGESDHTISGWVPLLLKFIGNIVKNCGNDNWTIGWGLVFGDYTFGQAISNTIQGQATTVSASGASNYRNAIDVGTTGGTVFLDDNEINNCGQIGISVNTSGAGNPIIVKGNHVKAAGAQGIYLYNSQYCTIEGNIVEQCQKDGLMLNNSSEATVDANKFLNNSQAGANQYDAVVSITSFDCIITNNEFDGVNQRYGYNLDNMAAYLGRLTYLGNRVYSVGTAYANFAAGTNDAQITPYDCKLQSTGIPNAGTFPVGAYCKNTTPTEYGTAGSKYYVLGWLKVTSGSSNVLNTDWKQQTMLSGN